MRRTVKRFLVLSLGTLLVLAGIAGLFLPFLQGILLLMAGLYVLSLESATARLWLERLRRRYPRVDQRLRELSRRARASFRRR